MLLRTSPATRNLSTSLTRAAIGNNEQASHIAFSRFALASPPAAAVVAAVVVVVGGGGGVGIVVGSPDDAQ